MTGTKSLNIQEIDKSPKATETPASVTTDPLWYKDSIIYQVHVKSFYDSNGDGYGDFNGLIEKLDYIQDLGVDVVWLLPFYPSPLRDDGYDIADYRNVNPLYGNRDDFKRFVDEAHRRGLKVITELVINHSSDQNAWFQCARRAPKGSKKRDYYVWSDRDDVYKDARIIFLDYEKSNWTWDPVAEQYYWHRFFHHQPDLNFDNPNVLKLVLRIMRLWFNMGVDGMRLDAIPYLVERDGTNCENLPETHTILKEMRKALDEKYENKLFLAEANQWPEDVIQYFGDGDECHMAYHFPVMPRMYMAVHQEDRHPITEILRRTPEIPSNCQWAMFLRNHDELTLEMVTEEERDYMWRAYAHDPMMRINLGIRRRLSPLLEHSRKRIELLNSMLLSMPGTPIIYYGDEIGMGENIFLGDRHGVRTPMQWSGDRNGGFSKAPFNKLYSPPNMDPVTGFQAINVEAQQLDPSSLLNWMKSILKLRKQYKVFGRGSIELLYPQNRKVLAYLRSYEDETVLCVANLSRHSQSVSIDLSRFQGQTPVEMFGLTAFHPIDDKPYVLTMGGHSFYWLLLRAKHESMPITAPEKAVTKTVHSLLTKHEPPLVMTVGRPTIYEQGVSAIEFRKLLERELLPALIRRKGWLARTVDTIRSTRLIDHADLHVEGIPHTFMLVEVETPEGHEYCFVALASATNQTGKAIIRSHPEAIIAEIHVPEGSGIIYDAFESDEFCRHLDLLFNEQSEIKFRHGKMSFARRQHGYDKLMDSGDETSEIIRQYGEQRTAISLSTRSLLKIYHVVRAVNPDCEIGLYLTEKANYDHTPAIAGTVEYSASDARADGKNLIVGSLQERVPNQGDAFNYTVDEFRRFYERIPLQSESLSKADNAAIALSELVSRDVPKEVSELLGGYLKDAATIGKRTAEMHKALCTELDPSFNSEQMSADEQSKYASRLSKRIAETVELLKARKDKLPPDTVAAAEKVIAALDALTKSANVLREGKAPLSKIRCGGNHHLGQLLATFGDFYMLNFGGEAFATPEDDKCKQSPLKDVAVMLRSFSYASFVSLYLFLHNRSEDLDKYLPWARLAHRWAAAAFIKAYLEVAEGEKFMPPSRDEFFAALVPFWIEKACNEIHYEAVSRPDWLKVPVVSLNQFIETKMP